MKCMNEWCENEVSQSTKSKFNRGITKTACCSKRCATIFRNPKVVVCATEGCCNFILPKQGRKFCSQSCAVSHNNFGFARNPTGVGLVRYRTKSGTFTNDIDRAVFGMERSKKKEYTCEFCGTTITSKEKRKYCSAACSGRHKRQQKFDKIEAGDSTLCTANYRNYLIATQGPVCSQCGWSEVNPTSGKVPIVMDHFDGNSENNSLDNLRLLCPNCDSLTPTYKGLNVGNGRHSRRQRYADGKSY